MSDEYIRRNPGDLIAAEDWNAMQGKVKQDIANQVGQVQQALDEFKQKPVNADKFDGKSSSEWIEKLNQEYAPLDHEHNGVKRHQRYFVEIEKPYEGMPLSVKSVVIQHNMGINPLAQVYELMDLPIVDSSIPPGQPQSDKKYKFCFCGPPHFDRETISFKTPGWDEIHWGDPIESIESSEESGVIKIGVIDDLARGLNADERKKLRDKFPPTYVLGSYLSTLATQLFEPGSGDYHFDVDDIYNTQWIRDREDKTVSELKETGQWPPYLVYRPRLVNALDLGFDAFFPLLGQLGELPAEISGQIGTVFVTTGMFDIFHLNMNELQITPYIFRQKVTREEVIGEDEKPTIKVTKGPLLPANEVHFMVLLRG